MKSQMFATFGHIVGLVVVLLIIVFAGLPTIAGAQDPEPLGDIGAQATIGTAFTYQGELKKNGNRITGTCQIAFSLYGAPSGGNQVGSTITKTSVSVVDGIFTTQLDFGTNIFAGEARWLEMAVKCGSDSGFTSLSPRQELTPAPYAIYAQNVSSHTHHTLDAADGDPTEAVFVDDEGRVGIGLTNPNATLHISGTGVLLQGGGYNFVPPGGGAADLAFYRGGTGFGILRRFASDYTIMQIWAPPDAFGSNEATLALVRGDEPNVEYVDIYNNGYPAETQHGIRIQKRGTGEYRDFVFDYSNGTTKTEILRLTPAGYIGIGTKNPGESLHIDQGNILLDSPGEQALRIKRSGILSNPVFSLGRITIAGDGSPEFRAIYADDATTERSVFEFDNKGIVASVKPGIGSHFEGFIGGDTEPLFRLNSSPAMQLEFGPGGSTKSDVAIRRETTKVLTFITGDTESSVDERARIDSNGNVGIGTTSPDNSRLHVASGNNQFIIEDTNGGTDAKQWLFNADANLLKIMTANDGFSSWADAIVMERNGVSLVDVSFPTGNVGVGTSNPQSKLQVSGYIQLDTVSSSPPSADCDEIAEEGRMKFDPSSDLLYICSGVSGWVTK